MHSGTTRTAGFRAIQEYVDEDGLESVQLHYFPYDPQGHDVNQVMMEFYAKDRKFGETLLRELVETLTWTAAVGR